MGDLLVIFVAWAWPALIAILLAAVVIRWALFADKARGRRRCPGCWHDLSRTAGLTCGECGRTAADERDLARTRRRWGIAGAAVIVAMAVAVVTQHSILNATWAGAVPDWVLVRLPAIAPFGELPAAARREIARRVGANELGAESLLRLARAIGSQAPVGAAEDLGALVLDALSGAIPAGLEERPGLPAAESRARAAALAAWRAELDELLRALPHWTEARAPTLWPSGEPAVAFVRATVWGPRAEWRVRRRGGDGPWLVGAGVAGLRREPLPVAVDAGTVGPDGRLVAEFDFEVRRAPRDAGDWGPWTPAEPLRIDAPVAPMPTESITAADGPEIDRVVSSSLQSPIILWNDPSRPAAFRLDLPRLTEIERPVAVGMVVELLEGELVRRRLRVSASNWNARHAWVLELEDAPALTGLRAAAAQAGTDPSAEGILLPGWTVRIRSDRPLALEALGRTAANGATAVGIWSGTVQRPARAVLSPDSPPARSYRTEFSDESARIPEKP